MAYACINGHYHVWLTCWLKVNEVIFTSPPRWTVEVNFHDFIELENSAKHEYLSLVHELSCTWVQCPWPPTNKTSLTCGNLIRTKISSKHVAWFINKWCDLNYDKIWLQTYLKLFFPIQNIANYKTIYLQYLNKSYDLFKKS